MLKRAALSVLFVMLSGLGYRVWSESKPEEKPTVPYKTNLLIFSHGDDWQLFAGDNIADLLKGPNTVVFVQLTRGVGHYECWEKGLIASVITAVEGKATVLSCADPEKVNYGPAKCGPDYVQLHRILRCRYRNAVMYFLRLPATFCPFCGHQLEGLDHSEKPCWRPI
jgi:hypothetical protein